MPRRIPNIPSVVGWGSAGRPRPEHIIVLRFVDLLLTYLGQLGQSTGRVGEFVSSGDEE
jgi:hypothetical protein